MFKEGKEWFLSILKKDNNMKPFFSMKNLGENGRLGNQLWQYAALKAVALRNNCDARVPYLEHKYWHGQKCMLEKYFNVELLPLTWRESAELNKKFVEKDPFKFDPTILHLKPPTELSGFFQSINYFKDFEKEIKKQLMPKEDYLDSAKTYIENLKAKYGCPIISMHLRRGDNTDGSIPGQYQVLKNLYGDGKLDKNSIYFDYFQKAREEFGSNVKFLIFTGGSRSKGCDNSEDMIWCKENFSSDEFIYSDDGTEIDDFCRIMACDGNIICHISSFGWWAAFLGMELDNNKRIVCPFDYHCDRSDINHRKGFYPESWIKL